MAIVDVNIHKLIPSESLKIVVAGLIAVVSILSGLVVFWPENIAAIVISFQEPNTYLKLFEDRKLIEKEK